MIDISADLTDTFYKDKSIKKGSVLIFDFEGSPTHLKIVRLNRKSKICIVKEVNLITEKELQEKLDAR